MRLFVALDLPDAIREKIREAVGKLKPLCKEARWARVEGMHMTLKFIGRVEPERLEPIVSALAKVQSSAPIELHFRGVGFFPTERRPRVFWAGIQASPNLAELAHSTEQALLPLEIAAEERNFTPHLTLARLDSPRGATRLVEAAGTMHSLDLGSTRETEFHLYESVTKPSGAVYTKLKSFAFVREIA